MTIYNNACIEFNRAIPDDAMEKLRKYDAFYFGWSDLDHASTLEIEDVCGDLFDELNEIVEILKPYGVAPLVGEYNRYFGDYDGYDVFTGEKFKNMDDVEYGGWLAGQNETRYDDLIRAATELVDYFSMHNKNCTKAQDEKVENLREALYDLTHVKIN